MSDLWLFKLGKWNSRHLSGSQNKPLDCRLNMCVTVCLSTIAHIESMSFFLTTDDFKNRKISQVIKGIDERKIILGLEIQLGTNGFLSVCRNQLWWRQGRGLICTCSQHSILLEIYVAFSLFYFLCLNKTDNFNIIIKKSSFIFLRYDLVNAPFVYCSSFSSRMVNKMLDFCYEKFMSGCRFSFKAYAKNVKEKATKCSLKATDILLDADRHVLT